MKIILATSELAPLTGDGPCAFAARNIAEELQACSDIDFAIALPATQSLLDHLAEEVLTVTAETGVPGGRIYPIEVEEGPTLYLLDHDELRAGFPPNAHEDDLAHRIILVGALLLDLITRLRPSVHLAHAIGWETALLPTLIRASSLPVVSVFTNPTARGHGPALSLVLEAARLGGHGNLLTALGGDFLDGSVVDRALADANASNALNAFACPVDSPPEPGGSAASDSQLDHRQLSHSHLTKQYGLTDKSGGPLLFIPTRNPEILLPILPRLLDTGTQIILATPRQPTRTEAVLIDLAHHRPHVFARIDTAPGTHGKDPTPFDGADFLLLLPADAADPLNENIAASAASHDCTPILPAGAADARGDAFSYRGEDPEAIWSALKRAIALHQCPERWREHLDHRLQARNSTGGLSPRLANLYLDAIKPALRFP